MIERFRNFTLFAAVWLLSSPALAQGKADGSWIDPGVDLIDKLAAGFMKAGPPIIGLFVLGLGFYAGFTGRMDWGRAITIILAGFLIMFGGGVVADLLS